MSVVVCDGCGRVAGEREVYCGACGRLLPGRSVDETDAAPPGWLVSPTAHDQAGPFFEPLAPAPPPVEPRPAMPQRGVPAYRVAEEARRSGEARRPLAPPPPPLPVGAQAGGGGTVTAGVERVPPLRALLVPLLLLALGSSAAAVALLVVHLLRDR